MIRPLSIGQYTVVYMALSLLILSFMGVYSWLEVERTARLLQTQEQAEARQELIQGVRDSLKRMNGISEALAAWDETRQQITYPEYYGLWRNNRVRESGLSSPSVMDVALYDKSATRLAPGNVHDRMPARLPGAAPLDVLSEEDGRPVLHAYRPISADPDGNILLGYLGLRFDLLRDLEQHQAFRHANLKYLKVLVKSPTFVEADTLAPLFSIQARENTQISTLKDLLLRSSERLLLIMFIALLLAGLLAHHMVVRPLRRLSREISAMRKPDSTLMPASDTAFPLRVQELENVRQSFNDYQARLAELHRNLEQSNTDFFNQARIDALTGAHNRRAFDEDWRNSLHDRRLGKTALILFDCDHFKAINDTYGHIVGDSVICAITRCLQDALRSGDRLYRIGGDEFATLITDTDTPQAQQVAERCLAYVLAHDFRQYGAAEPVTISIGLAVTNDVLPEDANITLSELQKRADLAMYAAKRPGGHKIVLYTPSLGDTESLVANTAINAVFRALREPTVIHMAYQTVARLPDLEEAYAEALIRIQFDGQMVYPGEIFNIVQNRNLDAEFDLAVIRAINRDMDNGRLPPGRGVSINVSAAGIVQERVVETLIALVQAEQQRAIVVEITETALITQLETASANMQRLRQAGAKVALDDFGSGYSSLRYLATMPVDLVKFDISMVRLLESGDARQRLMLEEITRMVIASGYQLVAEGIENQGLLDRVRELGFSHAQGYLLGKPV